VIRAPVGFFRQGWRYCVGPWGRRAPERSASDL